MSESFEELVAPFRHELLVHCYRMTGALSDAEDALQDALLRAWRGFANFEGRSSLRTWLYRITTNACLDLVAARRARVLPELVHPPGTLEATEEPPWLEPLPDTRPDAMYASREAVRLAFVIALQVLPPRQRATLILRDVVGLSAEETAATLETSVASVNSSLQRARAALDEHPRARAPIAKNIGELLKRYLTAWESGDAAGLIALLRSDAIFSMPPMPLWVRGPQAIAAVVRDLVFARGPVRMVACRANGGDAHGIYQHGQLVALSIIDAADDGIASIHSFLVPGSRIDFARFGLGPKSG